MSGNLGEKARAAFFALIMLTSVMAAGVAFSGSAAALQDPAQDDQFGSLVVTNGPAETTESTADIAATTVIDSSDLAGLTSPQLEEVNLTIDSADGSVIDGSSISDSGIQLEVIGADGSYKSIEGSTFPIKGGFSNAGPEKTNDPVVIGITDLEASTASNVDLAEGDKIRLTLTGDFDLGQLDGNSLDATMAVGAADGAADDGTVDSSSSVDLSADVPGPVKLESGGSTTSYSTITDALSAASSDDTITVGESQYDGLGSTLKVKDTNGLTIQAASGASPEVIVDAEADRSGKASQLFVQDSQNVTVDGVNFVGSYNSTRNIAGDTSAGNDRQIRFENAANATLRDFEITNDLTTAGSDDLQHIVYATGGSPDVVIDNVNLNVTTDGNGLLEGGRAMILLAGDRAEITNSSIVENADSPGELAVQVGSGATESGAIVTGNTIDASTAVRVGQDDAEVADNTFNTESTGMTVDDDFSSADGLLVENNEFNHTSTNDDTAIPIDGNNNIDITNNTIEGYGAGVTIGDGDNNDIGAVNISGGEILNSTDEAIEVTDNSDFSSSEITVDGVTISSDDSSSTGIDILQSQAPSSSVDIVNSEIKGPQTGVGINVDVGDNGLQDLNITDNQILNTTTAGIQVNNFEVADSEGNFNAHFNTISENPDGVFVDTDADIGEGNQILNVTFNDVVNNSDNGLEAEDFTSQQDATVNAKYSWWGSDAGPNSAGGDSITTASAGDATTEPFLLQSAVDNYDDSNLGGTNVLRFGHNVQVTDNTGSVAFPAVANRTAGESIEGDTSDVMIYKLVDGSFVDAGDQVPQTMEGHVVDLSDSTNDSAFVTITYSDDADEFSGGYTYEQGANLVGAPIKGNAGVDAVFNLKDDYVISPYKDNTENSLAGDYSRTSSITDDDNNLDHTSGTVVSPFSAYVIEVPSNETRFKGGNIPGGTDASEIIDLLLGN